MKKFFNTKYPIYIAGMFGCSDPQLALAAYNAGATPSLVGAFGSPEVFLDDVKETARLIPSMDFSICVGPEVLTNSNMLETILQYQPKYIDFWPSKNPDNPNGNVGYKDIENDPKLRSVLKLLRLDSKIIMRVFDIVDSEYDYLIDAYAMKTSTSAGSYGELSAEDIVAKFRKHTDKVIIPQGGISTSADIKKLVDLGADVLGIGTIVAACEESKLSTEAKMSFIAKTSEDIKTFADTKQHAIVYDSEMPAIEDDWNRSKSLHKGCDTGTSGHIYCGSAVDNVTKIRPISEIIEDLVKEIT